MRLATGFHFFPESLIDLSVPLYRAALFTTEPLSPAVSLVLRPRRANDLHALAAHYETAIDTLTKVSNPGYHDA